MAERIQSVILILRPAGIDPVVSGILYPEDQTPTAQAMMHVRALYNPGMVMRAVKFPEGLLRDDVEAFVKNASPELLRDLYRSSTPTPSLALPASAIEGGTEL